jgi:hypothetical protein
MKKNTVVGVVVVVVVVVVIVGCGGVIGDQLNDYQFLKSSVQAVNYRASLECTVNNPVTIYSSVRFIIDLVGSRSVFNLSMPYFALTSPKKCRCLSDKNIAVRQLRVVLRVRP